MVCNTDILSEILLLLCLSQVCGHVISVLSMLAVLNCLEAVHCLWMHVAGSQNLARKHVKNDDDDDDDDAALMLK